MAQVPYMDSYPTYLSASERELRSALWTSNSRTSMRSNGATDDPVSSRNISRPLPAHPGLRAESRTMTPPRAPRLPNQAVFIPSAPRTEPNLPSFVDPRKPRSADIIPQPPKTEPNLPSFVDRPNQYRPQYHISPGTALIPLPSNPASRPWTQAESTIGSTGAPPSLDWADSTHTLPQSTNTASNVNINCYAAPPTAHSCCCCCNRKKKPSRMARWKSAVKSLFHRNAEEESDVEHIETMHWTET